MTMSLTDLVQNSRAAVSYLQLSGMPVNHEFQQLIMVGFSQMSNIQFLDMLYQYDETTEMFRILNTSLHRIVQEHFAFTPKDFLHLWRISQLRHDVLPNTIVFRRGILHYQDKQCNIISLLLKHKKLGVKNLNRYRSILENIRMLPDKDGLLPFDYIPDNDISSYYGQKLLPDWSPRYHRYHDPNVKAIAKTFMTLLYVENTITTILSRELACAILKLV